MKRKVVVLLLSMMLFIGVFLYGAFQRIDKPSEREGQTDIDQGTEQVVQNVWIISGKDSEITYFGDGQTSTVKTAKQLSEPITDVIGDLTIKDGMVQKVKLKPDKVSGKVIAIDEDSIQIEKDGAVQTYRIAEEFKVYQKKDSLENLSLRNILVGYSNVDFVLEDDEVCAGLVERDADINRIRVLLRTSDFKDVLHESVSFTCTSSYTVLSGGETKSYKAGKKITVKPSSKVMKSGRIIITPKKETGKVKLLSVKRKCGEPAYRGTIEISKYEDMLAVVNELPLEEYLYAVIPSEMQTNFGAEALKVQAVCARTYAYKQLLQNNYSEYGAHIDDSVASQVYNNFEEDKNSVKAVEDTYGEVLLYENSIVEAYYFSTSWGCTADAKDVWLSDANNYLEGQLQIRKDSKEVWMNEASNYVGEGQIKKNFEEMMTDYDFSKEEVFKKFLTDKKIASYDSTFPWYRWSVKISAEDLQSSIEKSVKARYDVNPNLILTLSGGKYESKPIESIGTISAIEVENRTKSGLVNEIIIKGSKATIKVCSEYNIRLLLAPLKATIKRNDKSKVEHLSMLPSAFFQVTKDEDKNTYTFKGGGYGHGVGMSQNGAKAMADSGFNYSSILQHYYSGSTIGNLYL